MDQHDEPSLSSFVQVYAVKFEQVIKDLEKAETERGEMRKENQDLALAVAGLKTRLEVIAALFFMGMAGIIGMAIKVFATGAP